MGRICRTSFKTDNVRITELLQMHIMRIFLDPGLNASEKAGQTHGKEQGTEE